MILDAIKEATIGIQSSLEALGLLDSLVFKLLFFTFLILLYSVFVFYSYRFFSKRNILDFNFREYLYTTHPTLSSFFGFFVYLIEYIVILPFLVIVWFSFYSVFLLIMAKSLEVQSILLISAALIGSIRISSFVSEHLSQDLAKLLPFTLLALAITGDKFFSITFLFERIGQIPLLFSSISVYLIFLAGIELIMRVFEAINIFILKE